MKKEQRLRILLLALRESYDGAYIRENYTDMSEEQIKAEVKELNELVAVHEHYHKQFMTLTGEKFAPIKKLKVEDFIEQDEQEYQRGDDR